MMRSLASTTVQSGGFVFQTDNDDHPILDKIYRLIDIWSLVGIQINILLMSVNPAANGVNDLCRRLLTWMDAIESLIEGMAQALGVIGEIWRLIPEQWGLYWFKVSWNY